MEWRVLRQLVALVNEVGVVCPNASSARKVAVAVKRVFTGQWLRSKMCMQKSAAVQEYGRDNDRRVQRRMRVNGIVCGVDGDCRIVSFEGLGNVAGSATITCGLD
jgi:hypothetical protein